MNKRGGKMKKGFEGWYFKHQRGDDMLAFIPGRAESGAFVQLITNSGARQFDVPELSVHGDIVRAGGCLFSPYGCRVELPGVRGEIVYGPITPLGSDVMGPFRALPMECSHGVISMGHSLRGSVSVDGEEHCFSGGRGYMEKDSGTSFPSFYQWVQCNDFPEECSLMLSAARIPFCGGSFTGCICAVIYGGRELRLASYNGARVLVSAEERAIIARGRTLMEVEIAPHRSGHELRSPRQGRMTDTVRESANAAIRAVLWEKGRKVFDLKSAHAACEYVRR